MIKINLQAKTKPKEARIEKYWFENEHSGLKKTLFHRIYIPLTKFDSGQTYVEQPQETEIVIEWLDLKLSNPDDLDGLKITNKNHEGAEASIYVGSAHNWCEIIRLDFTKKSNNNYRIDCEFLVDFESEGVGENEKYQFQTMAVYMGLKN